MKHKAAAAVLIVAFHPLAALGHDIPNERVDRAIQLTIVPGWLRVDYEVSLSELTLTQDLRGLGEELPQGDRQGWLELYARILGPLNAKGLLAAVDDRPLALESVGYDLEVREHPRYVFHLRAPIPPAGRLSLRDSNYASSAGTSRLALRAGEGVRLEGYTGAASVDLVPIQPAWMLSDEEERLTKEAEALYKTLATARAEPAPAPAVTVRRAEAGLSRLLDQARGGSWGWLWLVAVALGGLHALQPGHGKTLAAACAIAPGARAADPVLLGLATGLAHAATVMAIALGLWLTRSSAVGSLHHGLTGIAGFVIAAIGLWRLGRALGGHDIHGHGAQRGPGRLGAVGLGLAAGLVPCWDAVAMLVLAAAIGRLGDGVELVLAFCLGLTAALAASGWLVWRLGSRALERLGGRFARSASALGGLAAVLVGLVLFLA